MKVSVKTIVDSIIFVLVIVGVFVNDPGLANVALMLSVVESFAMFCMSLAVSSEDHMKSSAVGKRLRRAEIVLLVVAAAFSSYRSWWLLSITLIVDVFATVNFATLTDQAPNCPTNPT